MIVVAVGAMDVSVGVRAVTMVVAMIVRMAIAVSVIMTVVVVVVAARAVDVGARRERGSGGQGPACLSVAGASPSRCATVRPVRCRSKKSPSRL